MNISINVKERLQEFGIKPSLQRIAIMEYLMKHLIHPTADMIFQALHPDIPTLSKTTVYNTVKLFAAQGAILELNIDGKNMRYDADISKHIHFKCKQCGCIIDLPVNSHCLPTVNDMDKYVITEYCFYCVGYCEKCITAHKNLLINTNINN